MDARQWFKVRMAEAAEAARRELEAAGAGTLVVEEISIIDTGHGVKIHFWAAPGNKAEAFEMDASTPGHSPEGGDGKTGIVSQRRAKKT